MRRLRLLFVLSMVPFLPASGSPDSLETAFLNNRWADVIRLGRPVLKKAEADPRSAEYADALWVVGRGIFGLRNAGYSHSFADSALNITRNAGPAGRHAHARALVLKALANFRSGDYRASLRYLGKADSVSGGRTVLNPLAEATVLNIRATAYEYIGDNASAGADYRKGLRLVANDTTNAGLWIYSALLQNLGTLLHAEGSFEEALQLLRQNLEICIRLHGDDSYDVAEAHFSLGNQYLSSGDSRLALEYFEKAERGYSKQNDLAGYGGGLLYNSMGLAYRFLGRLDEAASSFEKSLKARASYYGPDHIQMTFVYSNLAELLIEQKRMQEALRYSEKAVALREKAYPDDDPNLFVSRVTLAQIYIELGRLKDAGRLAGKLKETASGVLKSNPRFPSDANLVAAALHEKAGRIDSAALYFQRALHPFRSSSGWARPVVAYPVYTAYFDMLAAHRPDAARAATDTLVYLFYEKYNNMGRTDSRQRFTAEFQRWVSRAVLLELAAYRNGRDPEKLERAYKWAREARAVTLKRLLRENDARRLGGLPEEEAAQERLLFNSMTRTEAALAAAEKKNSALEDSLLSLRDQWLQLQDRFERKYPEYHAIRFRSDPPPSHRIQQTLRPGEMRLDLFEADSTMVWFLLTGNTFRVHTFRPAPGFRDSLNRFVASVAAGDEARARTSGQTVAEPFHRIGATGMPYVALAASGLWADVPLEALPLADGRYWIEKTVFRHVPPDDPERAPAVPEITGYAGFAPVHFSSEVLAAADLADRSDLMAPLPWSGREVREAAERIRSRLSFFDRLPLSQAASAYVENQATETAFFSLTPNSGRILHIATHTVLDPAEPAKTRFLLHPAENADGMVLMQELLSTEQRAALVFLSSCSSAGGGRIPGEGVWGLTSAFRFAGAERIAATRWPVADRPSAALAVLFLDRLQGSLTASEAMAVAKRKAIREPGQFRLRDWAAYIVYE